MQYKTLKEIAKELNISIVTIRRYIKSGRLKASKIGRTYRVQDNAIQDFINSATNVQKEKEVILGNSFSIPNQKVDKEFFNSNTPITKDDKDKKSEHKKHHPPLIIPGLNSTIMETVAELAGEFHQMDDIKNIVSEFASDSLSLFNRIEADGINDSKLATALILIDEAIGNLQIRRELLINLRNHKGIVLLPLPPHLCDLLLTAVDREFVFTTDDHLPPHLQTYKFEKLEDVEPRELAKRLENVEIIVLDGYQLDKEIFVRRNVANLIFQYCAKGLKKIHVHKLPHPPRHIKLVKLDTDGANVEIIGI